VAETSTTQNPARDEIPTIGGGKFPDLSSIGNFEALLNLGESVAAAVRESARTNVPGAFS
jgi:hypothetical protein